MDEITIMLVDKTTESENKTTGKNIIGEKFCKTFVPVLQTSAVRFNYKIDIFDTPDIFDETKSKDDIRTVILKCISEKSAGLFAIILVFNIANYTEEVEKSVKHFVDIFGEKIYQHCFVLLTLKDDPDEEGCVDVSRYFKDVPSTLKTLIGKCGDRLILFDNRLESDKRDTQVNKLLEMISEKFNGERNSNEIYETAKTRLQEKKKAE